MAQITLRDYLQETEDAISSGRTDDALQRCRLVLDRFPESLEAQRLMGEVYLAQNRLDEAQRAFDWVLTNDPENVIAYCDRALVCERRSDYDTALDCYQQAYELSRGNGQIRHEFNKLSMKANLPGFMFSRAGLARLYMRGDLLTQAILEWEAILGSNVYRLDARAGLMEAYWRDGQYDQVEQMAQQLLLDVPGCIKALLLLAHVISGRDMQRARELIRRAESFDPDLFTAQELFSDLFASRQAESFLQLLKKAPVTLDPSPAPARESADKKAIAPPQEPQQPVVDADIPIWTSGNMPGFEVPATPALTEPVATEQPYQPTVPVSPASVPGMEEWREPQVSTSAQQQEPVQEATSQPSVDPEPSSLNVADVEIWEGTQDQVDDPFGSSWHMPPSQDGEMPAPPAWLNMLTQGERVKMGVAGVPEEAPEEAQQPVAPSRQPSEPLVEVQPPAPSFRQPSAPLVEAQPPISPSKPVVEAAVEVQQPTPRQSSPAHPPVAPAETPLPVPAQVEVIKDEKEAQPPVEEEEESFFGPEWLKALGAETIEGQPSEALPIMRKEEEEPVAPPVPQQTPVLTPVAQEPVVKQEEIVIQKEEAQKEPVVEREVFQDVPAAVPEVVEAQVNAEDQYFESLRELEASLRAQGFVDMAPNSLAEIARSNNTEQVVTPKREEEPVYGRPSSSSGEDSGLSDALAQLGNLVANSRQQQPERVEDDAPIVRPSQPERREYQGPPSGRVEPERVEYPVSRPPQPRQAEPYMPPVRHAEPERLEQPMPPVRQPEPERYMPPTRQPEPERIERYTPAARQPENTPVVAEQTKANAVPDWVSLLEQTVAGPAKRPAVQRPAAKPEDTYTRPGSPRQASGPIYVPPSEVPPASMPRREQPAASGPVFEPAAVPPTPAGSQSTSLTTPRSNPLLENELETTMRRPAVRLQQLQARVAGQREQAERARPPEPQRVVNKAPDRPPSSRDRLVNGYQLQLAGNFDEAMQEYRLIIKSTPELLSEVVSNLRALLKLSPKYIAGYRVLGDAYMKQGEYLQAMESYNKALTMAKRVK